MDPDIAELIAETTSALRLSVDELAQQFEREMEIDEERLDRAPPPPMQLPIFNPATLRYENPPRRLTPPTTRI